MITPQDILSDWDKDSKIDESQLDQESLKIARLHAKYMQILTGLKVQIRKKRSKLETLSADKKRWIQGRMTKDEIDRRGWEYDPLNGYAKPLKSELEEFVKVDPDVQKMRDEIEDLKICIELTIDIVNSINWRHTNIRNAIDWQRFTSGG